MNNKKDYSIGLDIGTSSVGWAVVETNNQKIIRKGNKALWGVRLFDEASTAEDRRNKRSTRRRYDRRRERIKLLQEEFNDEIAKVDSNFFQKLQESKYNEKKDKVNKKIILTKKEKAELKEYQNKYKTIYHLREELVNSKDKKDIRLVYLAIHHIIKYRGNFLYQNSSFNINNLDIKDNLKLLFESILNNAKELKLPEEYLEIINFNTLEEALLNPIKNDTKIMLKEALEGIVDNNFIIEFGKLMVGNKCNINKLLMLEIDERLELSFSGTEYEDNYNKYESVLNDKIEIIDILKQIYDNVFLKKIFKNNEKANISSLMVSYYNKHKEDLKFLKNILRNDKNSYYKMFKTKKEVCIYDKYITNKIDYAEFKRELNKMLFEVLKKDNVNTELLNKYDTDIEKRIENNDFLPRITTTDNGKYPYQLNKYELLKIIENQGKYYPFLLEKTTDNVYKIVKLLEFRIPYYVGPLVSSEKSANAWLEKKIDNVKITPYNFDEIVDKEKTAEVFIRRMMSHCTYLLKEYALANNSILYSKYKVMNELKQIKINDRKMDLEFQKDLIKNFFMRTSGTITEKKFKSYLLSTNDYSMYKGDIRITGYSAENKFANNMQSYIDFFGENGIFEGTDYSIDDAEQIIEWVTIFEDKDILEKKVINVYSNLGDKKIQQILNKKYSGWGNLSKKLLTTKYYKDKETELYKSILDLMEETNENFMQILNNEKYNFQKMIQEFNNIDNIKKLDYSVVDELATSPKTKRGIYQALKIVKEITEYMGYDPKNIVIEMARGEEEKTRKDSRKDYIKKLYENCKNSIENYKKLKHELDSHEITSQRLFLYFIQEGKCLYTGTPLNLEDIENQSLYEIDHIIPRTLIKDDSIDNKALVLRECNQNKQANYVLPKEYRTERQKIWWKHLKDNGLMSARKLYSLTREKYSDEDIERFINRQLVETRQITKHVANILQNYYKKSNIIYLKAELSHNYREKYELFKFRDINDYHHAHDAYLAVVLGEYKEKFMKRKLNFEYVKELNKAVVNMNSYNNLKYGFVINSLDENLIDISSNISSNFINEETGELLFDAHEFNKKVEDTLYRNDILISRKTEIKTGKLYKETIYKKGKGTIPIKQNMPVEVYGGYSNTNTRNLLLVEYNENEKKLIGLPEAIAVKNNTIEINRFIESQIKLKKDAKYIVLKKDIPFDTELIYKNQNVFIKGYSCMNKNCELANAIQLKINKEQMKRWKYAFEYLLNNKKIYIDEAQKHVDEIYEFLINIKLYPLFQNYIEKIKNELDFNKYSLEEKKKIIKELLKMYQCNSVNANLKEFGLGDRIGRLSGINITNTTLISKSITGIREKREPKYEF